MAGINPTDLDIIGQGMTLYSVGAVASEVEHTGVNPAEGSYKVDAAVEVASLRSGFVDNTHDPSHTLEINQGLNA